MLERKVLLELAREGMKHRLGQIDREIDEVNGVSSPTASAEHHEKKSGWTKKRLAAHAKRMRAYWKRRHAEQGVAKKRFVKKAATKGSKTMTARA